MKKTFVLLWGSLLYMELVYHLASFGLTACNLLLLIPSTLFWAGLGTMLTGFVRRKGNRIVLWVLQGLCFLIFSCQIVYLHIFKQPLLWAAVQNAGGMALTNYWRETLSGIWAVSGYLILLAVPLILTGVLLKKKWLIMNSHSLKGRLGSICTFLAGVLGVAAVLVSGSMLDSEFYEEYREFYDPHSAIERFGVVAALQRDVAGRILPEEFFVVESWSTVETPIQNPEQTDNPDGGNASTPENEKEQSETPQQSEESQVEGKPSDVSTGDGEGVSGGNSADVSGGDSVEFAENVLPIDFAKLEELSDTKDLQRLTSYIQTIEPTKKNEYTGMFEGYNLIYLTAEGFSPYAIDETLTPTLYKLVNSGIVAKDYYVPLWQTSTSDGEYVNLTGLIPDQQFSMKRSAVNEQPFSLAAYFNREGAKSFAYHNNTLSYYERHLSHPNLGYIFKATKLGELTEEEWGSSIFEMEDAAAWPSSDLNMMKATIPEYINEERFHVYYMTVSGHMNYNFIGNQMSKKNKDAVAELPFSEEGRAYIACNIELDKALEYLIAELEKAGKLEKTVICLSSDHYPYGMDIKNLEELAGRPLEGTLEIYRNSLILWNSEMETIEIQKACSAMDLMPTLLNLFGFPYDSRLFVGRDILSESPAMVVFADRSFITDKISYYKKDRVVTPLTEEITDEVYLENMRTVVRNMNNYSSRVINNNYFNYILQCLPEGWHCLPDDWH